MNTQQKRILLSIIVIFIVILLPILASAQQIDPTPGEPEGVPIDGGLSLLVAAGVGYGAKKLKERKMDRIK